MPVSFAEGLVGITLDERYRLDAVLGEGGMGAVFRATHLAMDRKVAVKLLKPHLSNNEASLQRFAREARSTMKVESPHAVKVLDYGVTPQRDYYMVLEYLDGRTVQRELDIDGVFAPTRVVHIARQALHALNAAHAMGLVHRDLKPENILLMRVGADPDYTKLLDFGVAKLMEGAGKTAESQIALTQIGTVFGTPEFMSPEQACGHQLDGRSDLYSLGATMFAMLTGCGLFEAGSAIEWLTNHVRSPAPHIQDVRGELASYPELDDVLQRCLAKHREQRPRTAADLDKLLARLEPIIAGRPMGTPPPSTSKVKVFSSSMFFEPLPLETVDPGESIALDPATTTSSETPLSKARSSTSDILAVIQPNRRRLYLGIATVLVIGAAAGVGLLLSKRPPANPPTVDGAIASVIPDSAPPVDTVVAAAPADAPLPILADAAVRHGSGKPPQPKPNAALEHLRKAEAALRTGDNLKQTIESDLALRADPRNVRAKYLLGDALIKSGDLPHGCSYLRALGRNQLAQNRAKAAGCPD